MKRYLTILLTSCLLLACAPDSREITLTIIGTNDVHGALLAAGDSGGLIAISAYVNALRKARAHDGGAVLLIDAGDMWQGTLESNLTEGSAMVEAYNALDYAAAALGNHEFDFGPAGPLAIPQTTDDDPRGALKQRASDADFPMLAANLIDLETGEAVRWPNVQPSVLVDIGDLKVGIIGVMTEDALSVTLAANTTGLTVAPIAATVAREAQALRDKGATIVIVSAHADSECTAFDDPNDLSSCDMSAEMFVAARQLPPGLVDHIFAGHTHEGTAHIVNGISITQNYGKAASFGRVDLVIDKATGQRIARHVFAPTASKAEGSYEGFELIPDERLIEIAARAEAITKPLKMREIGIHLATPFRLTRSPESPLGNLYTDGLLAVSGADIAMHVTNNSIRADLPAGPLRYGSMFEMSPYDNQITRFELTGAELRQVLAEQAHRGSGRLNFSGMRVSVTCTDTVMSVSMRLSDGREVADTDSLKIAAVDYLALGGDDVLRSVMPPGGFKLQPDAALARDAIINWLQQRGGTISEADFSSAEDRKWTLPEEMERECRLG